MEMILPLSEIKTYEYVYRGEEERERWIMHYSSSHQILLVGDGDFSFSFCLAQAFGSASNIVATSLDSFDTLTKKYKEALSNLVKLNLMGAYVLHGVDATKLKLHTDLRMRKFDRIIFNFPHAGFSGEEKSKKHIKKHQKIVRGFFRNASGMLRPDGEIHINHKTTAPFCNWNIEELAKQNYLVLKECVVFKTKDYPGYNNKRGDGQRSDEPFPLGECSTFKFILSPSAKKIPHISKSNDISQISSPLGLNIPVTLPRETRMNFMGCIEDKCFRIFREYFNYVRDIYQRPDFGVCYSTWEYLKIGFARYMREVPGRGIDGYIRILDQVRLFHIWRAEKLGQMLEERARNLDFFSNTIRV